MLKRPPHGHPLVFLLLLLLLVLALPFAPYLLAEQGGFEKAHLVEHAHHCPKEATDGATHPYCLKCVMVLSDLPDSAAPMAATVAVEPVRSLQVQHYCTFQASTKDARAPPKA